MTGEVEKLDRDADVGRMTPEALWYDDAVLHYRYHRLKAQGQKYEGWTAEDMVNLHVRIVRELARRGLRHFDRGDELDEDSKPLTAVKSGESRVKSDGGEASSLVTPDSTLVTASYADVRPSGNTLGGEIRLQDVLAHFRSFKLRKPYMYLVGGLVVHGRTEGDIDILVKDSGSLPQEFKRVLEWRILRSLPQEYSDRVQFIYDDLHGPITDFVELYDLTVERVNPENRIQQMSLPPEAFTTEELLRRAEEAAGRRLAVVRGGPRDL